ncbi:MAG: MobA/MobL family protein [Treponema sp.]|nr:MobA/MobL family protein [Treponema sp.]
MDYISNPDRQEHLYAVFDTTVDERFWDYLAGENHKAFEQSGAKGECIEARELIIMLPPSLKEYDPDTLLRLFVMKFKTEYGLDCHAGLHHNKAETNYHIHLIYSERKPLEKPDVKIASRNMFYDETGKHRRTKKEILDAEGNIRPGCKIIPKGTHYDCKYFGPKAEQVGDPKFLDEVKHMYTDLINELVKDESERLSVFDRNGPYLATKKVGKNNPKADVIKADNEARMEWNRTVDEARVAGIPEDEIVAMRKELVSSEIQKSIKENGSKPELLGKIIKKAVATLAEKIKLFKAPKKKIPTFDFDEYNKMVDVNSRLQAVMAAIRKIDSKIEHKQELQKKYRGPQYQNFKVKLIKELGELLLQRRAKQDRLTEIVREAGYKDVSKFSKAFEKSCKLLEEYQAQAATMKKESVVKKLRANVEEAKLKPHTEKTLGMEDELKKKKDDDPR